MEEMEDLEPQIAKVFEELENAEKAEETENAEAVEETENIDSETEIVDKVMKKQPKKPEKKKMQTSKKVLIIVLSILLALLLIVLGVLLYLDRMIGLINYEGGTVPSMNDQEMQDFLDQSKETMDPDFTGDVIDPDDVDWDLLGDDVMHSENVLNILLVGQDRRPGESRARSDTMILCSFNKSTKELTLVSFMRDMYVSIPGYSAHKMNSAFAWGGFSLLNETLQQNFGIVTDGAFAVDFSAFTSVIDLIGGVDVYLTSTEANYINSGRYSQGINHMDGEDALTYARIRNIGNGDFGRTQRQRNVINAVFEKCKSMSLVQLNNLLEQVLPLLSTNMEKSTIMSYAAELLPMVAGIKMNENVQIPADGTWSYAWASEMSILKTDFEANRQLLWEKLYQ